MPISVQRNFHRLTIPPCYLVGPLRGDQGHHQGRQERNYHRRPLPQRRLAAVQPRGEIQLRHHAPFLRRSLLSATVNRPRGATQGRLQDVYRHQQSQRRLSAQRPAATPIGRFHRPQAQRRPSFSRCDTKVASTTHSLLSFCINISHRDKHTFLGCIQNHPNLNKSVDWIGRVELYEMIALCVLA